MNKEEVYEIINKHYRENSDRLIKSLSGNSGNIWNAEDVVQNAYLRACEYWESFNLDEGNNQNHSDCFTKWFNAILNNSLRDKINEERMHGMSDGDAEEESIETKPLNKLILDQVKTFINEQPDKFKKIYILHFLMQYHPRDISKLVPQTDNHIRVIIHNFKKQLKEKFQIGKVRKIYQ